LPSHACITINASALLLYANWGILGLLIASMQAAVGLQHIK
jgi:hypothetical protein